MWCKAEFFATIIPFFSVTLFFRYFYLFILKKINIILHSKPKTCLVNKAGIVQFQVHVLLQKPTSALVVFEQKPISPF